MPIATIKISEPQGIIKTPIETALEKIKELEMQISDLKLRVETQKPVGEMTNTTNEIPLACMISPIDKLSAQMSAIKIDIFNLKTEVDEILELMKFIEEELKK